MEFGFKEYLNECRLFRYVDCAYFHHNYPDMHLCDTYNDKKIEKN